MLAWGTFSFVKAVGVAQGKVGFVAFRNGTAR